MTYTLTITLDRADMEALLARAGREAPRDAAEFRALADAREQLSRADLAAAEQESQQAGPRYEQLSLFDASVYDA